jgi:hypothetical protein
VKLDFSGNDVEYLGAAMFINLRKDFPKLMELNGKDYSQFMRSRKDGYSMRKVLAKARNIQKQMAQTVKN